MDRERKEDEFPIPRVNQRALRIPQAAVAILLF
jgi:hypothetical protein